MSTNARLVVEVVAAIAQFREDLGRAAAIAETNSKRIERAIGGVKSAFISGLAGALSVGAITAWGKGVVDAAAQLQDLSEETGSSVERLSRLSNIAAISGKSFDTFSAAMERLAAGLSGSEELSTQTAAALRFLGVSTKDPAQALEEIALKLDKYADGTGKAAIARDLFGKSGVAFLSTLKAIADYHDVAATKTTEQARAAQELEEALRRMRIESTRASDIILSTFVPAVSRLLTEFTEGIRIAGSFGNALITLGTTNPFRSIAENLAVYRAELEKLEAAKASGRPSEALFLTAPGQSVDAAIAKTKQRIDFLKLQQRLAIDTSENAANFDARDIRARMKPRLGHQSPAGAGTREDDPAKKILQGRLKEIEGAVANERQILSAREGFLERYYSESLLSLDQYFSQRAAAQSEDLDVQVRGFDDRIAALRDYQAKAKTAVEREDVNKQIIELTGERRKVEQEAAAKSTNLWFDQRRAAAEYARTVEDVTIRLLELQGNTAAATKARLTQRNATDRQRFIVAGDRAAVDALTQNEELETAQAALNDRYAEFGRIIGSVDSVRTRAELALRSGAITELDSLGRISEANRSRVDELRRVAAAAQAVADTLSGPAKDAALLGVDQLRLKIEELEAASNLVADKFRGIFVDSFSEGFASLIDGTKSLSDAFKSMERSIVQSISHIAAQNIAESIFGKSGPGGSIPGFFGTLFGGLLGSVFGAPNFTSYATGPGMPQLGGPGGFAAGGEPPVGRPSIVGERGPELFVPKVAGIIVPNDVLMGRRTQRSLSIMQQINVLPGASRASATQAAASAAREARIAAIRNG